MAYGKLKADTLVYDNSGSDVEVTISSLGAKADLASPDFTTDITLKAQAPVKFEDDSGGEYVGLKAPTGVTTYTVTLPATAPSSGKVLKATSATALSWSDDTNTDTTYTAGAGLSLGGTEFTLNLGTDQTWTGAQRGTITDIGSVSSGALNIDLSASNNHKVASSGTPVFTFTNFGANGESLGQSGTITVTHTGSGVPTWNGHCNFAGGLASAPTITADAVTVLAYYVYEATNNTTGKVLVEGLSAVAAS